MNSLRKALVVLLAAVFLPMTVSSAFAADEPPTGKVVILNLERAIMSSNLARERMKELELQSEYADNMKKFESIKKEMEKKGEEFKKESPVWTADQAASYRKDVEFLKRDLQLTGQKIQAAQQEVYRNLLKDMEPRLDKVIQKIVEDEKISVILDKSAVLIADDRLDITALVTERLNALK